MYQIQLEKPIKIYFTGIGGISMSGLAEILKDRGFPVCGSDVKPSPMTDFLIAQGIQVFFNQDGSSIPEDTDVLVYTAAVHEDHPELKRARDLSIPLLTRAQLLGEIMRFYETPVAISGTHGKTTTTSMLSEILLASGADPTLSIGGILPSIGGNIRVGKGPVFLTEACEYTDSFLSFFPRISAILNVEADHLDYFEDLNAIVRSFTRFASLLPEDGLLIINRDCNGFEEITGDLPCPFITFGKGEDCTYSYRVLGYDSLGEPTVDVRINGPLPAHPGYSLFDEEAFGEDVASSPAVGASGGSASISFTLKVPGDHNAQNAVAALMMADYLCIPREITLKALSSFTGTKRRFEHKGSFGGVTVIDDYAHHPTEIKAALAGAQNCAHRDIWCVFQPHTYSRTKALLGDFAEALSLADHVILQKIYPARETDDLGISSRDIMSIMLQNGIDVHCHDTFPQTVEFLKKTCSQGDMVITMGAGDVLKIGEMLVED